MNKQFNIITKTVNVQSTITIRKVKKFLNTLIRKVLERTNISSLETLSLLALPQRFMLCINNRILVTIDKRSTYFNHILILEFWFFKLGHSFKVFKTL